MKILEIQFYELRCEGICQRPSLGEMIGNDHES